MGESLARPQYPVRAAVLTLEGEGPTIAAEAELMWMQWRRAVATCQTEQPDGDETARHTVTALNPIAPGDARGIVLSKRCRGVWR